MGLLPFGAADAQTPPECSLEPSLKAQAIPDDVCHMASQEPLPFFNALAWQTFKMLVWPAATDPSRRGEPDMTRKITDEAGLRTFETFKPQWELFRPKAKDPEKWGAPYPRKAEPCQGTPAIQPDQLVLGAFDEFGVISETSPRKVRNALVARNRTFVRYLAAYNRVVFEKVVAERLFDPAVVAPFRSGNEAPPPDIARMPDQALTVKSAWVELPRNPMAPDYIDPARFYVRNAWVQDPDAKDGPSPCRLTRVGLIALHIVHKTKSRPQWIWSTFEHVDNAPQAGEPVTQRYVFHDATEATKQVEKDDPPKAWRLLPSPARPPQAVPWNVTRLQAIESAAMQTNRDWQKALRDARSIWANYMLVMTQWPGRAAFAGFDALEADPAPPCRVGAPNTALTNVALETFFQQPVRCITRNGPPEVADTTCMTCHNHARVTDFIWSIKLNKNGQTAAGTVAPANEAMSNMLERVGRHDSP